MIAPVDVTCPICLAPPGDTCVTFPDGITRGMHEARETRALYARIEALEAEVARCECRFDDRRCELARAHDGPHRYAAPPIAAGDEVDIIDGLSRGHRDYMRRRATSETTPAPQETSDRHATPGVDLKLAREAWHRLVGCAFGNDGPDGRPIRGRFSIPVRQDDDDILIGRALDELEALRRDRSADRCVAVLALTLAGGVAAELTCSLSSGHDGDHEHVVDGHTTTWTGHRSGCDCAPCESFEHGRKAGLEEARLAVAGRLHLFSWGDRPIVEGCVAAIDKLRGAS